MITPSTTRSPATSTPVRIAPVRVRPRGRGVAAVLLAAGAALTPWLIVLGATLPATITVRHWPLAWVGLDALEALGLLTTGALLLRGASRARQAAAATSTLLVADAWFDVTTAAAGSEFAVALAMAACAELPLAAVCAGIAVRRGDTYPEMCRSSASSD
ncbi:hypothetical protein [Tsukamurella sp. NPDC003166]|uniref:hypothetical protein n=1 Tax=Tsukamurella sp. NPDC003166 TaxID=3154444 RepID=UPI0033A4E454